MEEEFDYESLMQAPVSRGTGTPALVPPAPGIPTDSQGVPADSQNDNSYADMMQQYRDSTDQAAAVNNELNASTAPEAAARATALEPKLNIPASVIATDLPRFEARAAAIDRNTVVANNPLLAAWVRDNRETAAAAQDDFAALDTLSKTLRRAENFGRSLAAGFGPRVAGAGLGILRSLVEPRSLTEGRSEGAQLLRLREQYGIPGMVREARQNVADWLAREQRGQEAMADAWRGTHEGEGFIARSVYSGAESMGQNVAGLLGTVMSRNPGPMLTYMFGQTYGESYSQGRAQGLSVEDSMIFAGAQGGVEVATETAPAFRLVKDLGLKSSLIKTLLNQLPTELAGEQIATVVQDFNEWVALRPDAPFSDYLEERPAAAAQTLIATLVASGGLVTIAHTTNRLMMHERAKEQQALFEALGADTKASKLRERLPAAAQDFVARATADGPIENLYVDPEFFATYWQSQKADAATAAAEMGITAQWQEAQATGGKMAIPTAVYARYIAPSDHNAAFAPELSFAADQMNARETQEFLQETETTDQTAQEGSGAIEGAERVREDVIGQLVGAGVEPGAATRYAALYAARYATRAHLLGIDPWEAYQRSGVTIRTGERPAAADAATATGEAPGETTYEQKRRGGTRKLPSAFLRTLASGGGISRQEAAAQGIDPAYFNDAISRQVLFTSTYVLFPKTGGRTFDDAALFVSELGYGSEAYSPNEFLELLTDALNGREPLPNRNMQLSDLDEKYAALEAEYYERYEQGEVAEEPIFFSQMERALEQKLPASGPAAEIRKVIANLVKKGDFKREEYEWSGVDEWLAQQKGKVTKDQVLAFVRANEVRVEPVVLGESEGAEELKPLLTEREDAVTVAEQEQQGAFYEARDALESAGIHRALAGMIINNLATDSPLDGIDSPEKIPLDLNAEDRAKVYANLEKIKRYQSVQKAALAAWTDLKDIQREISKNAKPVKFAQWQLAGGENYRELLLTLPASAMPLAKDIGFLENLRDRFNDSTFAALGSVEMAKAQRAELTKEYAAWRRERGYPDMSFEGLLIELKSRSEKDSHFHVPNVLVHIRFNERTIPPDASRTSEQKKATQRLALLESNERGGLLPEEQAELKDLRARYKAGELGKAGRMLFIEEVQSDWHQPALQLRRSEIERVAAKQGITPEEAAKQVPADYGYKKARQPQARLKLRFGWSIGRDSEIAEQEGMPANTWMLFAPNGDVVAPLGDPNDTTITREQVEESFLRDVETDGDEHPGIVAVEKETAVAGTAPFGAVPDAPFKKTWHELAMKRMLRWAVDNGFDSIAWTTGAQQVDRYTSALRQEVDRIEWTKTEQGVQLVGYKGGKGATVPSFDDIADELEITIRLVPAGAPEFAGAWQITWRDGSSTYYPTSNEAYVEVRREWLHQHGRETETETDEGNKVVDTTQKETELSDAIGKAMADRILSSPERSGVIEGEAITVSDTGMAGFYDRILPLTVGKYVKKWGGKVSDIEIDVPGYDKRGYENENFIAHAVDITPAMRESLARAQPLFQGGARGSITFMRDQAVIDLFKNRDLSSLIHESGHLWLEELRRDSRDPQANPRLKADMAVLVKWFGLTDESQIQREHHEQFARGFEAYTMEGKAPSIELRTVFARLRTWLLHIYRRLQGLDVRLNDDVRGVMDRLLASDREITQAEAEAEMLPVFTDATAAGMSDPEYAAYAKIIEDAHRTAVEEVQQKLMKEYARAQEEWWKARRAEVRAIVEAEVNAQPDQRAAAILTRGTLVDGSAAPPGAEKLKLDRAEIDAHYGAEQRRRLPKGSTVPKGGVPASVAADALGFASGESLVVTLLNTRPRLALIEAETDARMRAQYGDKMLDGSIAEEARAAVAGEARTAVVEAELKALHRQARKVQPFVAAAERTAAQQSRAGLQLLRAAIPSRDAIREYVAQLLANKPVRDIRPMEYLQAARRASRAAIKAVADKKHLVAASLKIQELRALEAYRQAIAAKAEVEDAREQMKKVFGRDDKLAKTRNMDMVNAARAILAGYGLGKTDQPAASYLEAIRRYDADTYDELSPLLGTALGAPQDYRQITLAQFRGLRDSVAALWHLSRRTQQVEIDGKLLERDAVIDELKARLVEVHGTPKLRAGYDRALTKWDKTKIGLLGIRAALRRVESWIDAMDGGDTRGVFRRYLWTPVSEAIDRYREAKKGVMQQYLDLVKGVEKSLTTETIEAPELGYAFGGKIELLHALLHTGNASNMSKLLRGYGWGEALEDGSVDTSKWKAFIQRMTVEGKLTQADYDFVQGVWDLMESLKPAAQKAHHQMYGYYFNEITAQPLETPFGTYRGGYVPAIADPFRATDAAQRQDREAVLEGQNSFMFPTTGRGFTKARVEGYARPLQLDMRTIGAHIDKVLRFTHIEPVTRDVGRLLISRRFRTAMDAIDPEVVNKMLIPWLQRSAQQIVSTPGMLPSMDRFWKGIRKRAGANVMVANVTNALQQITGLFFATTKVKAHHMRNALWQYMRQPRVVSADIAEKSLFMRNRVFTQHADIQGAIDEILLNPKKYEKARAFADKHGYFLQQGMQSIVDKIVWIGAYNQAAEQNLGEKEAVRHADAAVRETQGSFTAEDISRVEAGTPFLRAFMMFYNYFNMVANLLGTEFSNIATNELGLKKGAGRALYLYVFGFMIPAFIGDGLIRALLAGEPDEDDDGYLDDYLAMFFGTQARTLAAMVPGGGQVVMAGVNAWNDKWYDDRITTSPAVSQLESAVRSPYSIYQAVVDEGSAKRATQDFLTAVGLLSGYPTAALARPAGYVADVLQDRAEPETVLDVGRGLITGRDVNRTQ